MWDAFDLPEDHPARVAHRKKRPPSTERGGRRSVRLFPLLGRVSASENRTATVTAPDLYPYTGWFL
jgi:hypothetical protein